MNNLIGVLIAILYFANYHICNLIFPGPGDKWFHLNVSIYCLIILLAFEYKKKDIFIEKLFLAIVFNNLYVLIFKKEYSYTWNDVFFISFFVLIQYTKIYAKQFYRIYSNDINRIMAVYFANKPKKK